MCAASNPKWWFDEKCRVVCRRRHVVRNVVPMITCSPWNPVATKNVDPYAESAIVNGASRYSYACSAVSNRLSLENGRCVCECTFIVL